MQLQCIKYVGCITRTDYRHLKHLQAISSDIEYRSKANRKLKTAGEANRFSTCDECGQDIFYLELPGEAQRWWHEDQGIDRQHQATNGGKRL